MAQDHLLDFFFDILITFLSITLVRVLNLTGSRIRGIAEFHAPSTDVTFLDESKRSVLESGYGKSMNRSSVLSIVSKHSSQDVTI